MQIATLKIRVLKTGAVIRRGDLTNMDMAAYLIDNRGETSYHMRKVSSSYFGTKVTALQNQRIFRIEYPGKKLSRRKKRFVKPVPRDERPRNIDLHL